MKEKGEAPTVAVTKCSQDDLSKNDDESQQRINPFLAYKQAKTLTGALMAMKQKQSIKNGNVDILFRTVRDIYKKPPDKPASNEKVIRRTTETYITDIEDDHYNVKRARQKKALGQGHFTESWQPYRPLGDLLLEPHELVWKILGDSLPAGFLDGIKASNNKNLAHLKIADTKHDSSEEDKCDLEERRRLCVTAGMKDIKGLMEETERRLVVCRAGQPYVKHVKDCQERKETMKRLEEQAQNSGNTMVMQQVSGEDISLRATGGAAGSRRQTISRGDRLFFIKPTQHFLKLSSQIKCTKIKGFVEKISDVCLILCSIFNMRSRHLKSKTTLAVDILKALRRDPFAGKEGHFQTGSYPSSKRPVSRSGSRGTVASHGPHHSGSSDHNKLPESSHGTGVYTPKERGPLSSYMKGRGMTRRKTSRIFENPVDEGSKLETWDDLVSMGTKKNILKLLKKIPPWQQTYLSDDSTTAITRRKKEDEEHSDLHHAEEAVNRFKLGLIHAKEKLQTKNTMALEMIEKERLVMGRHKLMAFEDMHPLFELHKDTLRAVSNAAHFDPKLVSEKTADWYESLLSEAASLSCIEETSVDLLLTKLERFMKDDIRSIPNPKEKLALLVMSMPIYELIIPTMITALRFVLEEVLKANKSLLKQWLNTRHINVQRFR